METRASGRSWKIAALVLAAVLTLGVAASCTLGAMALSRMAEQEEQVARLSQTVAGLANQESDTVIQEDDVAVAGEYWIRSTLPISDAYRSGDDSALDDAQKETLAMASEVLDEILTEGMTPYEQEKAVYDWMCANLTHEGGVTVAIPTASQTSAEPHGVLKYGAAVCVGFATTFRLFMQMLDIPCMVVHNSYHSWDLVELDGEWYHVDIYSDVDSGGYANFNLTDDMCLTSHEWDTSFYPAATGLTYCYAYQSAQPLADAYDLPGLVRTALDSQTGSQSLYFLAEGKQDGEALYALLDSTNTAVSDYGIAFGRDLWLDWNLMDLGDGTLVSLSLVEYVEDPDVKEPDVDLWAKAQQAVDGAFGDIYGSLYGDDWYGSGEEAVG